MRLSHTVIRYAVGMDVHVAMTACMTLKSKGQGHTVIRYAVGMDVHVAMTAQVF